MNKIKQKKRKDVTTINVYNQKGQLIDDALLEKLKVQTVAGLIPPALETKGEKFELVYDISGYMPLKKYVRTPMGLQQSCSLLRQITVVLRDMESSAFSTRSMVFDLKFVLIHSAVKNISFICLPIQGFDNQTPVRKLFFDVIQNTAFGRDENALRVRNALLENFRGDADLSLDEIEGYINQMDTPSGNFQPTSYDMVDTDPPTGNPDPGGNLISEASTPVEGGTVLLGRSSKPVKPIGIGGKMPCLFREASGEKIVIRLNYFRIGKDPSQSDYVINDNKRISRRHAAIETEGKRFYITDNDSTNHVYVDGQMIPVGKKTEIRPGASIRLADERFTFDITN